MSNRSTIVALALLVLLASCACLGAFASWTLNNAMGQAATIAEETTAHTEQTTVQICAGLFNVGSCRTRQSSTATAPRPAAADPGPNPWPLILPLSAVLLLAVGAVVTALDRLDGAR
jgi:cytoskeletal protein RodZ